MITRIALVLLIVLVVVLLLHFGFMGSAHGEEAGCATCVTVLTASLLLLAWLVTTALVDVRPWILRSSPIVPRLCAAASRDSPTLTVVLRL